MKKIALSILSLLFPIWAFASSAGSSLSFAPPPTDVSVIFLGNIFGIVDGVLHGTGSQILGSMFGVFNSAVLALGGIIIMYTLMVSTLNTAEKGQMLGEKWSSIWVPLRSTLGLALLIPKASGYCLMQIFVMWIVVQGVGAADKVWGAALSYLNRGGVLIQGQMNPQVSLTSGKSTVASGAATILQGQVCMVGLQNILQNALQSYLADKQAASPSGPCLPGAISGGGEMAAFCNSGQVPDFLATVNTVAAQNTNPDSKANYTAQMPNFDSASPYASLNGICGTISWSPFSASSLNKVQGISTISPGDLQTAKLSRAIAIQQMYSDLSTVAQLMVLNNPGINPPANTGGVSQPNFSSVAVQQFGVPYLNTGVPCTSASDQCTTWGKDPAGSGSTPLFTGTELQGAITDYNGIMLPTLSLVQQADSKDKANDERAFIQQANAQGWLLAGSYFFNLSMLNATATNSNQVDSDTGLDNSIFDPAPLLGAFEGSGTNVQCKGYANLCTWLKKDPTSVGYLVGLLNGAKILSSPLPKPSVNPINHSATAGLGSSTVIGFINNSVMVNLPGQQGMTAPTFAMQFNISLDVGQYMLPWEDFGCSGFMCIGSTIHSIFYNYFVRGLFNLFLSILAPFITSVIQTLLSWPLLAISQIFQENVALIQQPSVNPVVALANMGVNYINLSSDIWVMAIGIAATPLLGLIIFPLLALIMPLLMSWLGIMVTIGFVTAYYIPFLPYMIFTFGSIAWLMAVIEAMVAAPIVALGVTHPEGHEAFGKGEQAIMILMNVFLRPAMMIIGYIAAIGLSYVSVWIINAGFANAAAFIQGTSTTTQWNYSSSNTIGSNWNQTAVQSGASAANNFQSMSTGYSGWAGIYGFFFSVIIYTTMYITVVQKSFGLIAYLPDKVLRWIGGQPEGVGEQAAQWAEGEAKKQVEGGAKETARASAQRDEKITGKISEAAGGAKDMTKGSGTKFEGYGEMPPE